jgi:STE24 endopeptidase
VNEDRSARYHRLRRRAVVAGIVAGAGWLALLGLSGAGAAVSRWTASFAASGHPSLGRAAAGIVAFVAIAALGYEAAIFPFTLYRSFVLERRYGLSSEPLRTWTRDHVKAVAVGVLLTVVAALAVSVAIHRSPAWWWAISSAMFACAGAVMAVAAPVALMPIFYRFNPLGRETLRERLVTLSQRAGVTVLGAYEWGLGEKTTRANAALVGLGRTRRILVSDTLLTAYSDDEIEVIFAHEIAHHVHRDVWSGLAFESAVATAGLCTAHVVLWRWGSAMGAPPLADPAVLPLVALIVGAVSLLLAPVQNAWSRHTERRADRFALALTQQPAAFISAMRRLGAQNLADERPSPATFWFFHTHPTMDERIDTAKRF